MILFVNLVCFYIFNTPQIPQSGFLIFDFEYFCIHNAVIDSVTQRQIWGRNLYGKVKVDITLQLSYNDSVISMVT